MSAGPIDVAAVEAAVTSPANGAILVFSGVVRDNNRGKGVIGLHYEAYEPMALAELGRIAAELTARWPDTRLAVVHRVGDVAMGEPSVVIAVGSPHRAAAYEASRYVIDELKARVPVWKQERYADGTAWIANRS